VSNKEDDKKLQEAFDDVFRYSLIMGLKFPWQIDDEGYKAMTESITKSYDEIDKFKDETLH